MQFAHLRYEDEFKIVAGNARSQAGVMVVAPGDKEGGPDNRHQGADQWLYVASGEGALTIEGRECVLTAGMLVLIERGEAHEIRATGDTPLKTLNFLRAAGVDEEGETLPAGESH
jgi:mannose-6-phosphate isomerase-like protein (cupin superfamily)